MRRAQYYQLWRRGFEPRAYILYGLYGLEPSICGRPRLARDHAMREARRRAKSREPNRSPAQSPTPCAPECALGIACTWCRSGWCAMHGAMMVF
jgi:hypothetical protein